MKLNATAEMIPVTWPEFGSLHPFVPRDQVDGYYEMIGELGRWLVNITGYDDISMQPNSGAQGEYAGKVAIRKYHESGGEGHRTARVTPDAREHHPRRHHEDDPALGRPEDARGVLAAVGRANGTHVVAYCTDPTVQGGVLLRLDLRSAHSSFSLRRRLVRVEPAD